MQFLVDEKGKKTGVVLSLEEYEHFLELEEEEEDIRDAKIRLENPEYEDFDDVKRRLSV